ncbi:hypothetical protein LCGC14_1204940 [marine sediment metagenome]|uniref:Peptidase S1 domain-containing protein n=1 Tax=marine sediment metagenome TaxID=412755 RepID=A0A0F9M391_9ZZZZ
MRRLLLVLVVLVGFSWAADQCYAVRLLPLLFGRRTPRVATPDRQTCEIPHPAVARIWIQTKGGTKRFGGTAILIDKLEGSGLVVSAAHCFSEMNETDEIALEFPNGENFACFLFAQDIEGDLALLTLDAPSADPMDIYLGIPKAGETSFVAGYGPGCYRTLPGSVRGYLQGKDGKMDSIQVTGLSRPGDSGGPITNGQGELIGVLSGTFDNRRKEHYGTTVGAYNGRLCQLLNKEFSLPWKKDREGDAGDSDVENIPLPVEPVVDDEARQMLEDVLSRITDLNRAVEEAADREDKRAAILLDNTTGNFEVPPLPPIMGDDGQWVMPGTELDRAADRDAERAAILAAGKQVIRDGLTDETIDSASTAAQPVLVRWLEGMGVAGWVAVVVVGILLVVLVRWLKTNAADVRSGKTKSVFDRIAASTAWKGDDAVARQITRRLYGVDVLKEAQAEAKEELPSQAIPQPTVADLRAQIVALEEKATK